MDFRGASPTEAVGSSTVELWDVDVGCSEGDGEGVCDGGRGRWIGVVVVGGKHVGGQVVELVRGRREEEVGVDLLSLLEVVVDGDEKVGEVAVEVFVVNGERFTNCWVKAAGGLGVADVGNERVGNAVAGVELDVAGAEGGDGTCTEEKQETVSHVGACLQQLGLWGRQGRGDDLEELDRCERVARPCDDGLGGEDLEALECVLEQWARNKFLAAEPQVVLLDGREVAED